MRYFAIASLLAAGAFASTCHPDYPCCNGCDVVYTDNDGDWGVENNNWCVIPQSCNAQEAVGGYPYCNGCNVYYSDESGDWGVENNDWCLIPSRCRSSNGTHDTGGNADVIPVITLISSSGTSDFATQPVEKHIAQMSRMGREMPPEPYYEDCVITIEDTDGKKVINGVNGKVKVRGNWTSNYVKKGLRMNFDEAQSVLGLNDGKKFKSWVLLAEYKDGSMLRNKSAFALSREILGVDGLYASDSKLVELRINDEYFGVYLLAEVQQINDGRVSITKGKDDYTGTDIGYLLELDTGYSMYEEKMESLTLTFNDNAPLKPFDGNGGSGKTIQPNGGGMGGGFIGGGGGGFPGFNWGGNTGGNAGGNTGGNAGGNNQNQQNGGGMPGFNWGGNNNQNNQNNQNGNQQNNGGGFPGGGGFNWGGNLRKRQFFGMGDSGENMTIKSDVYSQEQHDFIASYINNVYKIMYEAAYNQKAYKFNNDYTNIVEASNMTPRQAIEAAVDVNSLADMFIISEMTCDADLYYSSFYMDVDFGPNGEKKLRFEAPWDFDSGLGNKERCPDGKGHFAANVIPDNGGYTNNKINAWLAVIMYEDWYQDIIRSKWTKAYDSGVFGRVVDMINSDAKNFAPAFTRNYEKWNNIIENSSFASELSKGAKECKTHAQAADYLAKWFQNRVAFVNSFWHK